MGVYRGIVPGASNNLRDKKTAQMNRLVYGFKNMESYSFFSLGGFGNVFA